MFLSVWVFTPSECTQAHCSKKVLGSFPALSLSAAQFPPTAQWFATGWEWWAGGISWLSYCLHWERIQIWQLKKNGWMFHFFPLLIRVWIKAVSRMRAFLTHPHTSRKAILPVHPETPWKSNLCWLFVKVKTRSQYQRSHSECCISLVSLLTWGS